MSPSYLGLFRNENQVYVKWLIARNSEGPSESLELSSNLSFTTQELYDLGQVS